MGCDEDDLVLTCCTPTTVPFYRTHLSNDSSSFIPTNTSTSNNHASANIKHSHPNRTSLTTSPDSTEPQQDNASNWEKKRRRGRRKVEKQPRNLNHHSNTLFAKFNWRPFGLILFLLFLFISPLNINALPQQNLDHLPRLQRSIVSEPINIKDNVELQKITTQNPILDSSTSIVQQVTSKTTQKPTTTTIFTSTASTPAPTPFKTKDVLLDPDSVILFNRSVHYNDEEYQNPERKTEIFNINSSMDGTLTFVCDATVRNPRLPTNSNLTFDTHWIDSQTLEIVSNNSVLKLSNIWSHVKMSQKQYRCGARLIISSKNISGIIHSRSIILKPVTDPVLTLTPLSVEVPHMQSVHLRCSYNTTIDQIEEFYWTLNGTRILPKIDDEEYKIYNVNTYSLLYIFNMHTVFRNGLYSCHVLLTNGEVLNSSHSDVRIIDDQKQLSASQIETIPPEVFESRMGDNIALECWKPDVKETRWYRRHSQLKELISTEPVLFFKNASARLNGDYECQLEDNFGSVRFYHIEVYVDYNFFRAEPVDFTITRKHQGTPAKLLCHTIPAYEEKPSDANWYRNGRLLDSPEDRIYRRTSLIDDHHPMRIGRVIYFAMAQVEDQGFYECVVKKQNAERSQKILLLVEQTTNLTLTNLDVTVDHAKSCFTFQFDIPEEIDFRLGTLSTYFLLYYADRSKPLNIIPTTDAKCAINNRCTISCWTPSYFEPATNYTFRMSAVFYDESKITPLSHTVNATSWDGPATRGVHLNWIYKPELEELKLTWKKPPELAKSLTDYRLELAQLDTEFVSIEEDNSRLFKLRVNGTDEEYLITNITAPFSVQLRLIPLTRSGIPAHLLQSAKDFGFTLVSVLGDDIFQLTDESIDPPDVKIHQVGVEPKFELHFDGAAVRALNVTSIRVQYRPLISLHLNSPLESKEIMEADGQEETNNNGKTIIVLKRGLKLGTLYQICAVYERSTQSTIGYWHCENVPLFDEQGQLSPIKVDDTLLNDPKQLTPRPVNCQKSNCRCIQSKEDQNVVLIKWKSTDPLNYRASAATSYIVHYTLNETDPGAPKWATKISKFYQDGNETIIEMRGLFPSLHYQLMLEAQNEFGVGVEGTYFNCTSPKNLDLPPPVGPGKLNKLGDNVAHIYWDPPLPLDIIENMPDFDGYVLRWRSGNASEQSAFVEGHLINNVMISNLVPGLEYTAFLTSHSKTKGESSLMSQPFSFHINPLKPLPTRSQPQEYDKVKELMAADAHKPFYQTLRFKAYAILAIIAIFIIVCCAGLAAIISMKYYDYFQSPEAKERRRKKKLKNAPSIGAISSGRASNASSRLSLNSIGSGSNIPTGQERESLIPNNSYGLPLHRELRHKKNPLDLKGGLQGYRPRVNKTAIVLKDPCFKETALELNKDPTGLGKPLSEVLADMRKTQEEEIAMYEKRRYESKVQNEMELQTFSIRYGDFDTLGYGEKSLPSTSSTTSHHSHHRHRHHSNRHRPRLQKQDHVVGASPTIRNYPISDDDGEQSIKKESFQAEIHPRPYNRRALFAHKRNRPPTKTRSLDEFCVKKMKKKSATCSSDSRLQDTAFVIEHSKPLPRHFCKRPSLISLQETNGQIVPPSRPSSEIQTPSTPFCATADGQMMIGENGALEFHLGANGIERRRLKTTTATPTYHPIPRKKFSVGTQNGAVTASLPNLSDSGIVYDQAYFHHPSHDCPMTLHPIASMKVLRLGNEVADNENEEAKNLDAKVNDRNLIVHPTFNYQHLMTHDQIKRRTSVGAADGESAVSTSSGASSRGSGASHRYEEYDDEEVDMTHESSQLISPQTPIRTFIPMQQTQLYGPVAQIFVPTAQTFNPLMTPQTCISPASITPKDYCSVQICDYHEDKNPIGVVNKDTLKEAIDRRWFHENV